MSYPGTAKKISTNSENDYTNSFSRLQSLVTLFDEMQLLWYFAYMIFGIFERKEKEPAVPLRDRPVDEIARALSQTLPPETIAYAIGYERADRADMQQIPQGKVKHGEEVEMRLRDLAEVTEILTDRGIDKITINGLMFGMNTRLEERAPAALIREGQSERVIEAAPYFMTPLH